MRPVARTCLGKLPARPDGEFWLSIRPALPPENPLSGSKLWLQYSRTTHVVNKITGQFHFILDAAEALGQVRAEAAVYICPSLGQARVSVRLSTTPFPPRRSSYSRGIDRRGGQFPLDRIPQDGTFWAGKDVCFQVGCSQSEPIPVATSLHQTKRQHLTRHLPSGFVREWNTRSDVRTADMSHLRLRPTHQSPTGYITKRRTLCALSGAQVSPRE